MSTKMSNQHIAWDCPRRSPGCIYCTTGYTRRDISFNMTPVIDIVLLLIIFFLVVCKFIEAENFPVTVPDECKFARNAYELRAGAITLTVMKTGQQGSQGIAFAVGAERISASDYDTLVRKLAQLIDARLAPYHRKHRIITLRIDKDICFGHAQYALAGVAASTATDIRLAVLKDKN